MTIAKNYNINWSEYFEINAKSKSGLSWIKPKYYNGTPNYDRIGEDVGSIIKGVRNNYWIVGIGGLGSFLIHRIIWVMINGDIPYHKDIDHIDGDGLNNNHKNLREVDKTVNSRNKRIRSDNTTGVNGIHYIPSPTPNPKNISDSYGAQFSPEKGKILTKRFSLRKYGKEKAFELAYDWLGEMKLKYSTAYSDRHGEKNENC